MSSFLLSFILCLICSKAAFKSYDGSNCAYVYDSVDDFQASFPLDVCITDYDKDHYYPYQSRQYVCTLSDDGSADIEVYTYYGKNCSGSYDESRSVLGDDNNAYRCGDGESQTYDACYLEYKEYDLEGSLSCDEYEAASYQTKYVIVGVCIDAPRNMYYRCDPSGDSTDVQYVEFVDDECCHLAYSYTAHDGPDWETMSIATGCDAANGVRIEDWNCMIADVANDADVYTDNTNEECTDAAKLLSLHGVVMTVFVVMISIMY